MEPPPAYSVANKRIDHESLFKEVPERSFVTVLKNASPRSFASFSYLSEDNVLSRCKNIGRRTNPKHFPSVPDIIAHLKLLRAFSKMKARVLANCEEHHEKTWHVFITNAVRRFIVFVSCLDYLLGRPKAPQSELGRFLQGWTKDDKFNTAFQRILPPLDVLMVWHSYSLKPRSFYDNFMRKDFYKFANMPFPFHTINQAINNDTFEYEPAADQKMAYYELLIPFINGNAKNQILDLGKYDISREFNMYEYWVDVRCPRCKETLLTDFPYTADDESGFADTKFRYNDEVSCLCGKDAYINRDKLCIREMTRDYQTRGVLPGVYKHFSSVISRTGRDSTDSDLMNQHLKAIFREFSRDRPTVKAMMHGLNTCAEGSTQVNAIFGSYLEMNLIHATVSAPEPEEGKLPMEIFEISEDLVGCMITQDCFVDKMNTFDWLGSYVIRQSLEESIARYSRFFHLLSENDLKQPLIPTPDIDLVWHTHQLSTHYYFKDCFSSGNSTLIDHADKLDAGAFDFCYEATRDLYSQEFGEEYSLCFCWYCVWVRSNSNYTLERPLEAHSKTRKYSNSSQESYH